MGILPERGSAESVARVVAGAGLAPPAAAPPPRLLARNAFVVTAEAATAAGPAIVKLYPYDLAALMRGETDPRFATIGAALDVAPYFADAVARARDLRRALDGRAPEPLAAGVDANGVRYAVLRRVEGVAADPAAPAFARTSREVGALAAALRRGAGGPPRPGRPWCDLAAEAMHAALCALPPVFDPRGGGAAHADVAAAADALRDAADGDPAAALVHGDLAPENVVVAPSGAVRAFVDVDLAFRGPAGADFRRVDAWDADGFLDGYGATPDERERLRRVGVHVDLLWELVGAALVARYVAPLPPPAAWIDRATQVRYLLRLAVDERLRRGPVGRRVAFRRRCAAAAAARARRDPAAVQIARGSA